MPVGARLGDHDDEDELEYPEPELKPPDWVSRESMRECRGAHVRWSPMGQSWRCAFRRPGLLALNSGRSKDLLYLLPTETLSRRLGCARGRRVSLPKLRGSRPGRAGALQLRLSQAERVAGGVSAATIRA